MKNKEKVTEQWNVWSDKYFADQYENTATLSIIKNTPVKAFPVKVWEKINRLYPCLNGLKICVPSSGDNLAVFAFHLLGAKVTSCDISSEQIKNARRIADEQGWTIDFHICDSMELDEIKENEYDMVYTSNGVHTWISDFSVMYRNFNRILKKGGHYIFFETHPFIRPFDDAENILKIKKPYSDTSNNDWRVQDYVNSLIESELSILCMEELSAEKDIIGAEWWNPVGWDEKANWHINPYAALPQWISFCTIKQVISLHKNNLKEGSGLL